MGDRGTNKKVTNSLLALSSAAVLAVYAAGYQRTKAAADKFVVQAAVRHPITAPVAVVAPAPSTQHITSETRTATTKAAVRPRPTPRKAAEPRPRVTEPAVQQPAEAVVPVASTPVVEQLAAAPAVVEPPAPPKPVYKDGTYYGWGTSRHGDIQAEVIIKDGRILSATVAQCYTRYPCSVIANLPPQVAQRQSPETDYVSGATQSTNAFYYGVVEALAKAKQ
jgi:uncharacterized protein with FMN-binding domain